MKIKPVHFIIGWTLLNLLQAAFTELTSDEGYYWFYSTSPEWGYYDHPPFLAWIVWLGYSVFHNEFGVRVINVLMSSAALLLFFRWLPAAWKERIPVYLLILAAPLANYLAFIIFPDGPLLFFVIVFLTACKRFLEKETFAASLIIGLAAVCMLYSKYHGILIIGFTVLSNLRLLRSKYFYLSAAICIVLFIPHILWQQAHGFPSVAYHLSGRVSSFSTKHVLEYLSQQIFAIGPSLIFIPFVSRVGNSFEKTLLYIIAGTFLFFFFASFKAFVHFHWTSIAVFPLLYFAAKYFCVRKKTALMWILTVPFILLLFVFRLQLMVQVFPFTHLNVDYYHGRKEWAKELASSANGRPVVFTGDFREPPLYSFYTGNMAAAIFSGEKRKTQYDTWHFDDSLQHKNVLLLQYSPFNGGRELVTVLDRNYYIKDVDDFRSYYNLPVKITSHSMAGDSIQLTVEMINEKNEALEFRMDDAGNYPVLFSSYFDKQGNQFSKHDTLQVLTGKDDIPGGMSAVFRLIIKLPGEIKTRQLALGIGYGILPDAYLCFFKP